MTAGGTTDGTDTCQEGVGHLSRSAPPSIDGTRRRDRGGRQSPERRYNGHLVIEDHGQRLTGPLGGRAECSPLPQRVKTRQCGPHPPLACPMRYDRWQDGEGLRVR